VRAVQDCLDGGAVPDIVALAGVSRAAFDRAVVTALGALPRGAARLPELLGRPRAARRTRRRLAALAGVPPGRVLEVPLLACQAAQAVAASGSRRAAVLVVADAGEWGTVAVGEAADGAVRLDRELHWPDSPLELQLRYARALGLPDAAALARCARDGRPTGADAVRARVRTGADGAFALADDAPWPPPGGLAALPAAQRADLAAAVQTVVAERVLAMARGLVTRGGHDELCVAGTLAHDPVVLAALREGLPGVRVLVHDAPGAAAAGAALYAARTAPCGPAAPWRGWLLPALYLLVVAGLLLMLWLAGGDRPHVPAIYRD
jgi:carbamoyltransferase